MCEARARGEFGAQYAGELLCRPVVVRNLRSSFTACSAWRGEIGGVVGQVAWLQMIQERPTACCVRRAAGSARAVVPEYERSRWRRFGALRGVAERRLLGNFTNWGAVAGVFRPGAVHLTFIIASVVLAAWSAVQA